MHAYMYISVAGQQTDAFHQCMGSPACSILRMGLMRGSSVHKLTLCSILGWLIPSEMVTGPTCNYLFSKEAWLRLSSYIHA
jgi:hypothetical protein